MKKVFLSITYLIMVCLIIVYLLVNVGVENQSIMTVTAKTGLSPISFILCLPTFVLSIVILCVEENPKLNATRDFLGVFCSGFSIICSIIVFFMTKVTEYYVPILALIFAIIVFVISILGVLNGLKNEKLEKNE